MKEQFSAQELSTVLGVSRQAVLQRASRQNWDYSTASVKGGKQRLFKMASLPVELQTSLLKHFGPTQSKPTTTDNTYDQAALWQHYERATQKKKDQAELRVKVLRQVMELVDSGTTFQVAAKDIASLHEKVTAASIKNWYHGVNGKKGLKHYDRVDWLAASVPAHTGRTAKAECSSEAWDYFKADYLRLEKPTAPACYERLKRAAKEHGWTIPSLSTLERRIRELPVATRTYLREGEHALMRLFPPLQRTVQDLHAMEWINGDGYQHNVFVKWPDGTIERPKTWFWQDVYSRRILTYRTDATENTDTIRLSFGDLVENYGIPDHATIDNTRAAANKWMTGGVPNRYRFKVKADDPIGIFPMMDVKVHWTSVIAGKGHGQAKPVERAFGVGGLGEYIDKHPALAGAYTGPNPMAKPENYGSKAIPLKEFLAVVQEGVETFNAKLKRNTEICGGIQSFDQAFETSYSNALVRKATAEQRRLWMLAAEAITIQRDGSFTLEAGGLTGRGRNRYADDSLLEFIGQKVVVRFDPQQLHEQVHVYTLDGRYITEAECLQAAGYGDTETGRTANRLRKQKMKAAKQMADAEQRMSALDAAQFLPTATDPEPPENKVVRPVFNQPIKKAVGSEFIEEETSSLIEESEDLIVSIWNQKKKEL